jgi:hypothetical protein
MIAYADAGEACRWHGVVRPAAPPAAGWRRLWPATARVEDGKVHFFGDLYGHDRDLARALRQARP